VEYDVSVIADAPDEVGVAAVAIAVAAGGAVRAAKSPDSAVAVGGGT